MQSHDDRMSNDGVAPEIAPPHEFWHWFLENEQRLLHHDHTDENREEIFDDVLAALHKVDENLSFEFGPQSPTREFIVSAGGIKDSFPAVLRLQAAQPALERWEVTYFRPRRDPISTIEIDDITIKSREMEFSLLSRDKEIGLEVFISGYDDEDGRYKQIGYLFLDEALGEFDVETKVFYLRFFATSEPLKYERMPFQELPERFDELYDRLNGLSSKPS